MLHRGERGAAQQHQEADRPYSGLIEVPATDLERVSGDLGEDFPEDWPGRELPCDAQGRPSEASGLS